MCKILKGAIIILILKKCPGRVVAVACVSAPAPAVSDPPTRAKGAGFRSSLVSLSPPSAKDQNGTFLGQDAQQIQSFVSDLQKQD